MIEANRQLEETNLTPPNDAVTAIYKQKRLGIKNGTKFRTVLLVWSSLCLFFFLSSSIEPFSGGTASDPSRRRRRESAASSGSVGHGHPEDISQQHRQKEE